MEKDTEVTVELDTEVFKQVENTAKGEKRTLEDEAAHLLEKGILISEAQERETNEK